MRTVKASILLGVGVLFLALAPLLRFYALPHLEKQPADWYFTDVGTGQGTYLDAATLTVTGPVLLTVSRTERGDVKAGNDTVAVWDIFTRTQTPAGTVINAFPERWAFNRHSGNSIFPGYKSTPHKGQFLVWPFNAPKKTFLYWDQTAKQAFPARYIDTEKLNGKTVYRYTAVIPPTKIGTIEVPGSLVGQPKTPSVLADEYYRNPDSSALVDPRTGAVVNAPTHPIETLRLPGSTADALTILDVKINGTPKTVKDLQKKASDGAKKLDLIGIWLPIGSLVLGLVLVGVAIWWDRRKPKVITLPDAGVQPPTSPQAPRPPEPSRPRGS